MEGSRRRPALHTQILIGLLVGGAAGVLANRAFGDAPQLLWVVDNIAQPIGQVFLRLLFMVVVPLIFTSLALGVASLGDSARVGRIGLKSLGFFLATTAIAASLGLLLVNVIQPGAALDPAIRSALLAEYASQATERVGMAAESGFGINTFVNIIPRNPLGAAANTEVLSLIFFTLVFGVALTRIPKETAAPVLRVLEGVSEAVMVIIGFAMKLAPLGVAGLIFAVTARFGVDVLRSLSAYVLVVLAGLTLHLTGVIPLLARVLAGIGPRVLFSRSRALMVTAFSTSSSNATLPTTMRTAEEGFGVPREVSGFVLPLGATMNMNGTALFEGMTVLFLAQVFGVELDLPKQVLVIAMSVITAVGVAGVPGGSIPLLVLVLELVGVPGEGIALILGVDRLLDMARTVPNVMGDLLTSLVITRSEGMPFRPTAPGEPDFEPDDVAPEFTPDRRSTLEKTP